MSYDTRKRFMLDDEHWAQVISVPIDLEFPPDEMAKLETWSDFQRWLEREKDRRRSTKRSVDNASGPSGRRINARPRKGGPFIAVDSEGVNVGEPVVVGTGKKRSVRQKQRTVLWMAGGAEGFEDQILADPETLEGKRERIWEYLLSLPRAFAGANASDPAPIFVGFGFNYDVGQLVAGMPYKKAWELYNGVPWDMRNVDDFPESLRRWTLMGDHAISHIPRKSVALCKLRNPSEPFRYSTNKETGERRRAVDWVERIEVYDVHGFFQSSLLKAIEKFPGVVTADELETIKEGKKARGGFTAESLDMLIRYTGAELKALASMMERLRSGFKFTDPATGGEQQLEILNWWGAGAIAQALLKAFLGKKPTHILGDMSKPWLAVDAATGLESGADAVDWVTYARFGGRIELCKQGVSKKPLYLYDISSAYPAVAVQLPSMAGGKWVWKQNPTREEIENSSILSMFKVKTRCFSPDLPFYPLPFRTESGSIMFPPEILRGRYMRDDVIAAFRWFDHFNASGKLTNLGVYRERPQMTVSEAMFFVPGDEATRPLSFIRDLFEWRASLPKDDMRGQVIKLGINSVYGKFAQRVGKPGDPPSYGSLWYAAAITAGTRRKLMEAALSDAKAVIAFATDAIFSTKPLPIHVPERKVLGEWEFLGGEAGSFVQSGVYTIRETKKDETTGKPKLKTASRGFSPKDDSMDVVHDFADALDHDLFVDVPSVWRAGGDALEFEDQTYIGLGASLASPKAYQYLGYWKTYSRELRVNSMSAKRIVPFGAKARAKRADGLIDLIARPYTVDPTVGLRGTLTESAPSIPDWMATENRPKRRKFRGGYNDSGDSENVEAGLSSDAMF